MVAEDDWRLLIGGGLSRFILAADLDEGKHFGARNKIRAKDQIELTVGGQTCIYDSDLALDLDIALKVARVFWRDHTLSPLVDWT